MLGTVFLIPVPVPKCTKVIPAHAWSKGRGGGEEWSGEVGEEVQWRSGDYLEHILTDVPRPTLGKSGNKKERKKPLFNFLSFKINLICLV